MGGLLHLVQHGRAAAPSSPLIAVPNVTAYPSTASVPITVLLYDGPLLCGFNVAIKGLIINTKWMNERSTTSRRVFAMSAAAVAVIDRTRGHPSVTFGHSVDIWLTAMANERQHSAKSDRMIHRIDSRGDSKSRVHGSTATIISTFNEVYSFYARRARQYANAILFVTFAYCANTDSIIVRQLLTCGSLHHPIA